MQVFNVPPAIQDERHGVAKQYRFFTEETNPNPKLDIGYIIFPAGARVPETGFTFHPGHEFSYVVSGSLQVFSGGTLHTINPGDCTFIPAREEHYSYNITQEDCVLKYILIED